VRHSDFPIKEKLSQEIYASRRDQVGAGFQPSLLDDDESDDDLVGYDPIAPGRMWPVWVLPYLVAVLTFGSSSSGVD
jgi:hypothetical protein